MEKPLRLALVGLVVVAVLAIAFGRDSGREAAPPVRLQLCSPLLDAQTQAAVEVLRQRMLVVPEDELHRSMLDDAYVHGPLTVKIEDGLVFARPREPGFGARLKDAWRDLEESAATAERADASPTREIVVGDDCNQ